MAWLYRIAAGAQINGSIYKGGWDLKQMVAVIGSKCLPQEQQKPLF